jgi:hypothetical protein
MRITKGDHRPLVVRRWSSTVVTVLAGASPADCGGSGPSSTTSPPQASSPGSCPTPSNAIAFPIPGDGTVTSKTTIEVGGANNSGSGTPRLYVDGVEHSYTYDGYGALGAHVPLRMGANTITIMVGKLCRWVMITRRPETNAERITAARPAARRRQPPTGRTAHASGPPASTNSAPAGGWPAQVRANFVNACTVTSGGNASVCGCVADKLAAEIPVSQVDSLAADDPRVRQALQACGA